MWILFMIFVFVIGAIGAAFKGDFSGIEKIFSFLVCGVVLVFGFWLIYKIGLLGAAIVMNVMWIIPFLIIKAKQDKDNSNNQDKTDDNSLKEWKRNK